MRKIAFVLCSVLLIAPISLLGQTPDPPKPTPRPDLPPVLIEGMRGYKQMGPDEAVRQWIKNSPIDGSKDALSQSNILRQVQDFYGPFEYFEVIQDQDLTPHIRVIYLSLNYQKGPLFGKFVFYRTNATWILTSFNFNSKEDQILPANFYQSPSAN
jgi:hypothetical protein